MNYEQNYELVNNSVSSSPFVSIGLRERRSAGGFVHLLPKSATALSQTSASTFSRKSPNLARVAEEFTNPGESIPCFGISFQTPADLVRLSLSSIVIHNP